MFTNINTAINGYSCKCGSVVTILFVSFRCTRVYFGNYTSRKERKICNSTRCSVSQERIACSLKRLLKQLTAANRSGFGARWSKFNQGDAAVYALVYRFRIGSAGPFTIESRPFTHSLRWVWEMRGALRQLSPPTSTALNGDRPIFPLTKRT